MAGCQRGIEVVHLINRVRANHRRAGARPVCLAEFCCQRAHWFSHGNTTHLLYTTPRYVKVLERSSLACGQLASLSTHAAVRTVRVPDLTSRSRAAWLVWP